MNIRQSSKKVQFVLNEVRNININEALAKLSFMNKKAAKCIHQTITSALNNLQQSETDFDADNLYIKEAYVGKSIVLKRFRARAKGRASPILKPYSNLTIILSENINKKGESHGSKS